MDINAHAHLDHIAHALPLPSWQGSPGSWQDPGAGIRAGSAGHMYLVGVLVHGKGRGTELSFATTFPKKGDLV